MTRTAQQERVDVLAFLKQQRRAAPYVEPFGLLPWWVDAMIEQIETGMHEGMGDV
jgi:hypothetical protein